MTATTIRLIGPVALATVLGTLVACGGSEHVQKSGATTHRTVTLTLAMPDGDDPLGHEFAEAVARRSGGSVRLRPNPDDYASTDPANEVALAKDLERGRADVGYLPARAWAAAGVDTFRVLLAPFVVTTDAAAQTLADSPVAGELLATLPGDVVGLGLVPAQARRLLASKPAVRLGDYAGLRLRIVDNPQTAATFSALGATPVQGLTAQEVSSALERHEIDGAETSPDAILNNNYTSYVSDLSGYGLFPKYQSIVLSRRAWERLSDGQRAAIRRAAQDIVAAAKTAVPKRAADNLQQLCNAKVRIAVPTNAQLQGLVAAAQPAIDELGSDPQRFGSGELLVEPGMQAGTQPLDVRELAGLEPGGGTGGGVGGSQVNISWSPSTWYVPTQAGCDFVGLKAHWSGHVGFWVATKRPSLNCIQYVVSFEKSWPVAPIDANSFAVTRAS